jgi:flagellar biogenesis protein FliO
LSPLTSYIVETLITLLGVIALAVLVLYGARRLGVGRPAGPLSLVGRLPLDGRRAIYLVRVDKTVFVVEPTLDRSAFSDVLARVLARPKPPASKKPSEEEST